MSDYRDSPNRRDTLETYSSLVRLEVKSLTSRLAEMSVEVATFAENFGAVLLEIEDLSLKVDAVQTGIDFCRSELGDLKKALSTYEQRLQGLQELVDQKKLGQ